MIKAQFVLKQNGGTAVDAVEKVVRIFEENGRINAGVGACLNSDGEVECDAMIMDGHRMETGTLRVFNVTLNCIHPDRANETKV